MSRAFTALSRLVSALSATLLFCTTASGSDLNGFVSLKGSGGIGLSLTSEGFDEFWAGRPGCRMRASARSTAGACRSGWDTA